MYYLPVPRLSCPSASLLWERGRLRGDIAHRYRVKEIQNCEQEIDLRRQEELLREFAEMEYRAWLQELGPEFELLKSDCKDSSPEKDLAFRISEHTVLDSLFLERVFWEGWEGKLKTLFKKQGDRTTAVCDHVRSIYSKPHGKTAFNW